MNINILKSKTKAALIHFCFTLSVALFTALIVFKVWYPQPYTEVVGGLGLWKILVAVELVMGPLLSFVVFNPSKSFKTLALDYSVIASIQVAALAYGLHSTYIVRPIFAVFVVDRIEVVSAFELSNDELALAPDFPDSTNGLRLIGVRAARTAEESDELTFGVMETGRDVHLLPKYYSEFKPAELLSKALAIKPYIDLVEMHEPEKSPELTPYNQTKYVVVPLKSGSRVASAIFDLESNRIAAIIDIGPWELGK